MSSIFFYEFLDELPFLKKLLINNKNILIISTNYIASQQLIKNNINFKELYEFYKEKKNYEKHLKHSLNIPKLLEKSLFNNFKSLKENKWNIFEDFFYPIKIVYDQIYYFSNCVNEILTKYKPKIIYVKYNQKIEFTSQFLFSSNQSVLFHLLKSSRQKIKIKSINKNIYKKNEGKNSFFSFGQAKNKLKYFIFEKNIIEKGIRSTKKNIISLSCNETNTLIKAYPALKKSIINLKYSENKLMDKKYKKQNYDFTKELNKDSNIKKFFFINNFDISKIFIAQISNILLSIENITKQFEYYLNLIEKSKTKLMIFSTMAPFDHQNVVFNKICEIKKIPKVTWSHGGYCSIDLEGYDVTDFKTCSNHFSYGSFLNQITNNKNFLPKKIFKNNYQNFSVGSAIINQRYNSLDREKNDKKKIIFFRGNLTYYNQMYFPLGNTAFGKGEKINSSYNVHKKILNVLKNYQDDYEITFKNYPSSNDDTFMKEDNNFWKNFLLDNGMLNIRFISNEKNTEELLCNKQLVILPWLSTTFFQSLPFKNKIFVYDDRRLDEYFKRPKIDIFYSNNINKFTSSLDEFLPKLNKTTFYHDKNAIKYFLNGNKLSNIKQSFEKSVSAILKNSNL